MPAFDSFTLAEEWISEHYFTADTTKGTFQGEVLKLRKDWDADAKDGQDTILKRFSAIRTDLQVALSELGEDTTMAELPGSGRGETGWGSAATVYARLRAVLGFTGELTSLAFERGGSDLVIERGYQHFGSDLLWLEATPADSIDEVISSARPLGGVQQDDKQVDWGIAKLISELYLCEPAPKYIAVTAGRFVLLTERERWPEGRYLAADALLVADRKDHKRGGEVDRFLAAFGRASLAPQADGTIWWDGILEESVKHAVSVSQDLRHGIRESIEIIANNVLERRTAAGQSNGGVDGNVLAQQSLRFLYRILFLLYAEASPEMGVLPVGATEYDDGYGLERLRELALVELNGHESQHGTHLYESLNQLFLLVNGDHRTQNGVSALEPGLGSSGDDEQGLDFQPLKADLFERSTTALINDARLGNQALQQVLLRLLLTGEKKNQDRGFVSYANLGINQLGAVYEGLMSYTGFIATEDLHEVAKDGNAEKGSWVVSVEKSQDIEARHFVRSADALTGEMKPILHERGSFVFRLAGRERQQSASYYTPEVLTRFVVSQALAELLTEDTTADRILELSVCEPALGSGAFAIEAVRQLAEEYLKRKQTELGSQIPADQFPLELQKVKAQIALHQVHGVDLNATAVELAEVSLWLDTMVSGLQAPWFGLRLKRGNSLIGARRATYSREQVLAKKYLAEEPQANPLTGLVDALESDTDDPAAVGRIHHFLVPGEGWGAAAQAKEVKDLAADAQKSLKDWRKQITKKLAAKDVERLMRLSRRVETLWQVSLRRLQVAEAEARRDIDYFGKPETVEGSRGVSRAEIEKKLGDQDGLFQRLKRVMDAWNALWFWPVVPDRQEFEAPPSFEQWLDAAEGILGQPIADSKKEPRKYGQSHGQISVLSTAEWNDLDDFEIFDRPLSGMKDIDGLKTEHPWLNICEDIAAEQGFFHWELEFASVFGRGGFDLQVGNPPWVRPDWDEKAIYAEFDPWWQLNDKQSQALQREKQATAKGDPQQAWFMSAMASSIVAMREVLTSKNLYPVVSGLRPDLYRSFMERTWTNASSHGIVSLIHPESHFTEKKAQHLRAATYRRLRRHWQFINEMHLFEIHNLVTYGVHVYGASQETPEFLMAASLYHPDTVERSIKHEGGTEVPGLKDAEGKWDTRPHPERILAVDMAMLKTWAEILDDPGTSPLHARMVYPVNRASAHVLEKLSKAPRVRDLGLQYSSGWNETTDRKKGYFEVGSKVNDSWDDVILQGPHFTVANPFAKEPNPTMRSNKDWTEIDLEALPADFIPRTSYQPQGDKKRYDRDYTTWKFNGEEVPARSVYRLAWRRMASTTGVRTLFPIVIPPWAAHVDAVMSGSAPSLMDSKRLLAVVGLLASIPLDFWIKAGAAGDLRAPVVDGLPMDFSKGLEAALAERSARLICTTEIFAPLWTDFIADGWTSDSPARTALDRRMLQVEVDVLAGMSFSLSIDELCTIYKTQFPVLRGYEQSDLYDANGRKVPGEMNKQYRKVGESGMAPAQLKWTHPQSEVEYTFEFPFRSFDREDDMRAAYAKFEPLLRSEAPEPSGLGESASSSSEWQGAAR
ncbi:Eco57I restriction-modification methylase domain-containing protein [Arthrobacter rhombi]|uniref:Eco57I restriction-modification methylase domain-containing protein n=1 Tax=Arthrobacter rhombi TaxID=71253 RepID=UPI003FD69315